MIKGRLFPAFRGMAFLACLFPESPSVAVIMAVIALA